MDSNKLISSLQQIQALTEECIAGLGDTAESKAGRRKVPAAPALTTKALRIDFDMPTRPFIKKYAKGMSGPQRFTLLLAGLVNGDLKKEVQLKEIHKTWNAMTALMDKMKFNRFFTSQAKDRDWVESKQRGFYSLRPSWKEIFKDANG